ncbi:MAG: Inosine/uridine-preferring nucleoside hydrolase [Rariglobus sp.]|jgi:inosine-uridine nucleoside N-ribohydrolase|nr:Inosine/uridine-preferring nucleoside hydrolase [Rariglobus sp.]
MIPRLAFVAAVAIGPVALAGPVKIIFDTDYSTDCDDPGALAVLHALADNGEVEILATGASTLLPKPPGAIDVVNTYYGRPNIPIGATKVGPARFTAFADFLFDNFPHNTPLTTSVPDAIPLYRQILAAQPDNSVVFVTVGYLTNIAGLLKSPADGYSPLTGQELVAAKVKEWVCMGGNFWTSSTDNVNFSYDSAAAYYSISNFPGKLTFMPREVASVPSPLRAGEELNGTPITNPVRIAYHKYFGKTTGIDRHCADLATVLYAVRGKHDYWDMQTTGSMNIKTDATFTWDPNGTRDHNYLVMKGGYGVYSNKAYVEGVLRNLLKQAPAVLSSPHAPTINVHPQNIGVSPGQAASFSVSAAGNPAPSYQWQKNDADISGATGSTYTTPLTTSADNGAVYRVVITNGEGSVTSNGATLTVTSATGGLIAHYTFDEISGSIVNHGTTGSALNLTDTGGLSGRDSTGSGGYGASAHSGSGNAFNVPASGDGTYHTGSSGASMGGGLLTSGSVLQSSLQGSDGAFTYEAFISLSTTAGEQNILAHDGSVTRGFLFQVNGGLLRFYTGTVALTASIPTTGDHAFTANAWFHVAVAYTGQAGVTGNLTFYWTALGASASSANLIGTATLTADLDGTVGNVLGVGTTTRSFFRAELNGSVDEVRINGIAHAPDTFAFLPPPPDANADTSGDGIPDAWAIAHGFNPALNSALGDPDGDGVPNLLEFALGLDPTIPATAGLPVVEPKDGHLTLTVARNPDASHLLFVPEVSDDLTTWSSGPDHVTTVEDTPSLLRAYDNQPLSASPRRFMRIRIAVPPS